MSTPKKSLKEVLKAKALKSAGARISVPEDLGRQQQARSEAPDADAATLARSNNAVIEVPWSCETEGGRATSITFSEAKKNLQFTPSEKDAGVWNDLKEGKLVAVAQGMSVAADGFHSSIIGGIVIDLPFKSDHTSANLTHVIPTAKMMGILERGLTAPLSLLDKTIDATVLGYLTKFGGAILGREASGVLHSAEGQKYLAKNDPMVSYYRTNHADFKFKHADEMDHVVSFADEDYDELKKNYEAKGDVNVAFFNPSTFAMTVKPVGAGFRLAKDKDSTQAPATQALAMHGMLQLRIFEKQAATGDPEDDDDDDE